MKRLLGAGLAILFLTGPISPVRADDKDPNTILDKAIKAAGGEEKLKKVEAITWKSKGTITFNGSDNEIKIQATAQGLDRLPVWSSRTANSATPIRSRAWSC